jgi:alanyl-tRNA synthetase
LRFDYPLDRALTVAEKRAIEDEVRRIVRENHPVTTVVQPMAAAIAAGADAFFDEKYGEQVRTVRVEGYSLELCGGTHCSASGQIGGFVITADRSIGAGTRRVEAVTGDGADALLRERTDLLERIADTVGVTSVGRGPGAHRRCRRNCAKRAAA